MSLKFENIKVWNKALDLTFQIHELTRTFPKDEMYILTSQIKRASDSVCLNIAEWSTGASDKEFNRFMGIALRSAVEVNACLHIRDYNNWIRIEAKIIIFFFSQGIFEKRSHWLRLEKITTDKEKRIFSPYELSCYNLYCKATNFD